jgi:hypothetical protein
LNRTDYDLLSYTRPYVPNLGSKCEVCEMVELLRRHRLTLSFIGDSMTRQTFVGLECEIRKHGYNVSVTSVVADRSNIANRLTVDQLAWRYGLTETVTIHISSTTSSSPTSTTNDDDNVATQIHFYAMYRPLDDMEEVQYVFNTSDIVVFDFGLHYIPSWHLDLFKSTMQRVLDVSVARNRRVLSNSNSGDNGDRPHLLIWRETSAQHFNLPGGHFEPGVANGCVPITTTSNVTDDIRLSVLQEIATLQNYSTWHGLETSDDNNNTKPSLLYIPYRAFTSGLVHLHNPDNPEDCTHFCHTPYLWLPIWHHLKNGLQKYIALYYQQ